MKNYRIEQSARTKALLENIARRNGQQWPRQPQK
jgi:hypothetical protein